MEIRPDLITKNVLARVTSYDIFKRYCEGFTHLNKKFRGTLRSDDTKGSALIGIIGDDLLYKDFGEVGSYRAIPFVAAKFGVSYRDALEIINRDFNLGLGYSDKNVLPVSKTARVFYKNIKESAPKRDTIIKVKYIDYTLEDLKYWSEYYWTVEMLKSVDIYPISHFWLDNSRNNFKLFKCNTLAYTMDYYYSKNIFRRKLYQPFNSEMKFLSNIDDTIVQGYKRLDRQGDILVITSSLKDCGIFWRLGHNAVAPNSESTFLPEKFLKKMKKRFKRIIIWFDNDFNKTENTGVKYAQHFAEKYELEYFYTPDNTEKDPSDFSKRYGIYEFMMYFNSKIYAQ